MTDAEKIAMVKAMTEETSDEVIAVFLSKAGNAILNEMYKAWSEFPDGAVVPARYEITQCDLCVRYLARRGAEAEQSHSELGISRGYANANDEDILRRITPLAEVPK